MRPDHQPLDAAADPVHAEPDPDRPGGRFGDQTLGNLLALASAVAYAGVNALMRSVAHEVDPLASSLLRQVPLLAALVLLAIVNRPASLRPRHPAFIGGRWMLFPAIGGVFSLCIGNTLLFAALGWVGLGVATAAVTGGNLLASALISWLFLKERPTGAQLAGIALMLLGLVATGLSAQGAPVDLGLALLGFAFAVATGACYALGNSVNRVGQRGGGRFVPVLGFTTLGGVLAILVAMAVSSGPGAAWATLTGIEPRVAWVLLAAGAANGVALTCLTLAVRFTTVTAAMMLNALMIVFGVLFGWMFFGESANAALLGGCALILAGTAVGQLRRRRAPSTPAAMSGAAGSSASSPASSDAPSALSAGAASSASSSESSADEIPGTGAGG